jgi:two-component system, OmpR family, phosphate regulon sensor histidine kinase PhoR
MSKTAIWSIMGLMGSALIGIVLLQTYWIRSAIQENQSRFEKDVFSVLNRVSEKLQIAEEMEESMEVINLDEDFKAELFRRLRGDSEEMVLEFNAGTLLLDSFVLGGSDKNIYAQYSSYDNGCTCVNCERERSERYQRIQDFRHRKELSKLLQPEPITQRINISYLDEFIRNELANHGIKIACDYGVFSHRDRSFVITNGFYVVKDSSPNKVPTGFQNLYNSEYRVDLFPQDIPSPGLLMIYFPGRAGLFWGSVWKALLASIVFTGIILFCFAYTIQVILRQKKLSEMKTDFINNMTHEFKTPIATISLAADSITNPMVAGNPEKISRFANIIKQENKRMNSQVEKVLQMAVIDKRDFNLKLTNLDMHEIINQAVRNASLLIEKREGKIETDLRAEKYMIQGDLTHVSNIINNLLENANKYSPERPEISVYTRNVSNGLEVIVKDKGIGMTKEARKHIFDKFYRVHTGNLHDVKGFGLGLSYVKAMMTAHKGQIDVKSELGKGSSFILSFPFVQYQD